MLVRPRRLGVDQRAWLSESEALTEQAGYRLKVLFTQELKVLNSPGRTMSVLRPLDAAYLYRRLHGGPTLVVSVGSALISTDPTRDPPNKRASRTLEDFVAYKAFYGLVRSSGDVKGLFRDFAAWCEGAHCDGPTDPRALPLHVFDAGSERIDLSNPAGVKAFRQSFGRPREREDHAGRCWKRGFPHGRSALLVAGRDLPAGTHWDVSAGGRFHLMNSHEVWEIKGNGYVNVYPDEYVRGPRKGARNQVRRLWRAKKYPS